MDGSTGLDHVAFSVDPRDHRRLGLEGVRRVAGWLSPYSVSRLTVSVRAGSAENSVEEQGFSCCDVDCRVLASSGRAEFVDAVRELAVDAAEGRVSAFDVDEALVDGYMDGAKPDLFVVTGRDHLVDSLVWESVYSEVRFLSSWMEIERGDVESLVSDYRSTERRFGR